MWPLKFRLGAEYDVQANDVTATAECRDAFLGGEVTLDVLHRSVEYSKRFDLGGVSQIALRGRCDLGDLGGGSRGGKSSSGLSPSRGASTPRSGSSSSPKPRRCVASEPP